MKIGCVGAGLAGVAACWYLLQKPGISVELFDSTGIGGGASGIGSGLLHPFPGKHAVPSWRADEGMIATRELVFVAEKALQREVSSKTGIFRPAVTEEQKKDFSQRGEWREVEVPLAPPLSGLWIPEGVTVFTQLYLQGLWRACENLGATFIRKKIESLDELSEYDGVVIAAGFATPLFSKCAHLPLKNTPGQILTCRWKEPLPFSMVSEGHIALTEYKDLCRIGSTYEHGETLSQKAAQELKQKVARFYPPALNFEIVDIQSGVRISPKEGHQPILQQVKENIWVFTGLGSRGMLYHALLAKEIAEKF